MTNIIRQIQVVKLLGLAVIFAYSAVVYGQSAAAKVLQGHRAGITSVQYSKDGAQLASASLDGTARIWSTGDWKTVKVLNHGAEVYTIGFSPDGKTLVSGGFDKRVVFWDTKSGKLRDAVILPDWVNAIFITKTGQVVVGCADGIVRVMDLNDGKIKRTIDVKNEVSAITVSADERYLITGSGATKLWDFASGQHLKNIGGFGIYSFAFTPTGERAASADATGGIRIFSIPDGSPLERLQIVAEKKIRLPPQHPPILVAMPATSVVFSPDGNRLASGDANKNVLLWQVTGDKIEALPARTLAGHTMSVISVNFSPDGKQIASGSLDRTVRVWDVQ
jgi:WD40 repeat protein